ncbi:MAG: HAMP domain-containing histidine kinase, partial [Burkholderiales bacterium]|nr:HAMP domain-containing histidine kinase [Opitutaceae bacterium]
MTAATRRLWLYGLLLLLPALAVGALALGLLAREQDRLAEREQATRETRRAAVETRARLIAENIELLLGDVQSALMATLQEAPADEPRAFLADWRASNPLVRDVFRSTADGRIVWGGDATALQAWLADAPPWKTPEPLAMGFAAKAEADGFAPAPAVAEAKDLASDESRERLDQAQNRGEITANVQLYQRARQEIQEVAKQNTFSKASPRSAAPAAGADFAESAAPAPAAPQSAEVSASVFVADAPVAARRAQEYESTGKSAVSPVPSALTIGYEGFGDRILRSGWTPWRNTDDGLHLFGWRELPDRTVIGLELALATVKARLPEVFPVQTESGESYALRDDEGRVWHAQGGAGATGASRVEVGLNAALLPGWVIVGALAEADYGSSANGAFFGLGAMLIALLVLAIVAAGGLLVRRVRLSEAEAALKTSFVANVSHELKTPLTTIRLYAELLAQGRVRDEAKRTSYLETIGHETQRLARLVGNVLDFSRLEQGKKKYDRADFDLAADLRRLAEIHGPRLAAAGLELRVASPESLDVTTDRDAVEQIVLNLLDNACKYAAEGGEVALTLERNAPGVRVCVADRGPGVPTEQRERIFEKFHRVDDRLTAEKGGAGLGLSIARQLARGLGGDLVCRAREGG